MYANKELCSDKLVQGYTIRQTGNASSCDSNRPEEDIVSVCKGLVEIDHDHDSTVKFVLKPTPDQLQQYGLVDPKPHLTITRTCLTFLQSDEFAKYTTFGERVKLKSWYRDPSQPDKPFEPFDPFADYAIHSWWKSLPDRDAKPGERAEVEELLTQFLRCEKKVAIWFRHYDSFPKEAPGLHVAAMFGLDAVTRNLLEKGKCKVNATGPEGHTALHMAVVFNHPAIVRILLKNSARLDIQGFGKNTALHYAVTSDASWTLASQLDVVRELLRENKTGVGGVDIVRKCMAIRNKFEQTPMDMALEYGKEKREPYDVESDEAAMARARMSARYEILKLLVSIEKYGDYLSPLRQVMEFASSEEGKARLVEALIQRGTDESRPMKKGKGATGTTPLPSNKAALADLLHKYGAELTDKDKNGIPLLTDACERQLCFMAWILLQTGTDPNARRPNGPTALHCAAKLRSKSLISLLFGYDADLGIKDRLHDRHGMSALDIAAMDGDDQVVRHLLVYKGYIRKVDKAVIASALRFAILKGHTKIIHQLAGSALLPVDASKQDQTQGRRQLINPFREAMEMRDEMGDTVLHLALRSEANRFKTTLTLLGYGAKVDARDSEGRTPLELARDMKLGPEMVLLAMRSGLSKFWTPPGWGCGSEHLRRSDDFCKN